MGTISPTVPIWKRLWNPIQFLLRKIGFHLLFSTHPKTVLVLVLLRKLRIPHLQIDFLTEYYYHATPSEKRIMNDTIRLLFLGLLARLGYQTLSPEEITRYLRERTNLFQQVTQKEEDETLSTEENEL